MDINGYLRALVILSVTLLVLYGVMGPIQERFGMAGLAVTEFSLFGLSLLYCFAFRIPLADAFPLPALKARLAFGTVLCYFAVLFALTPVSFLLSALAPQETIEVQEALSDVFLSASPAFAFLCVAVLPAICEEAVFRGVLFASLEPMKSEFAKILLIGICFGVFHGNIIRFFPTALLGMCLTWLRLRTGSMAYPMILHCINNMVSLGANYLLAAEEALPSVEAAADSSWAMIYPSLMVGGLGVGLFIVARRLFEKPPAAQ